MDTGRHRAMVVVDPTDRRKLKGFSTCPAFTALPGLVYRLGVNLVVYALTREGSLARQLVNAD